MKHLAPLVAAGMLMAQTANTPPAQPPLIAELREMRADLNRFGNQHGDLFVELRGLSVHIDDMQRQLNDQRARIDATDPSKAAERLALLEKDLQDRKRHEAEERAESAERWSALWTTTRWLGGIMAAILANAIRQWVGDHRVSVRLRKVTDVQPPE